MSSVYFPGSLAADVLRDKRDRESGMINFNMEGFLNPRGQENPKDVETVKKSKGLLKIPHYPLLSTLGRVEMTL